MLHHSTPFHYLAYTDRTHVLQLEFTTRCDLKCTYCAVSQPGWRGADLDLQRLGYGELITEAAHRRAKILNLHGHGETTLLPGWVDLAQVAVDSGALVTICTNFAHLHTPAETEILSRFHGVTISIDTVDPVLFKRLRRGGDLRTLVFNMVRLAAVSKQQGRRPRLTWCCVLSDLTWSGIVELTKQGLELGVSTFTICNLNILPLPPGGVPLRHIADLPASEAATALRLLREAQRVARAAGAEFHIKAGITETLELRRE